MQLSPPSTKSSHRDQVMDTMLKMNENLCAALGNLSTTMHSQPQQTSYRKVPDLIIFSGDITEWPLFKSNFEQSTKQWKITKVENIVRLQKSLKGKAREAVSSLMVHERNLPHVLE